MRTYADQLALNDVNANGQANANVIGTCSEVRKRYRASIRPVGPCSEVDVTSLFTWVRIDKDFNSGNIADSAIYIYTTVDGTNTVAPGYYTFLYETNGSELGQRVFYVNSNGLVEGYTPCL